MVILSEGKERDLIIDLMGPNENSSGQKILKKYKMLMCIYLKSWMT